jgi:hypothetical protein
LDGAQGHRAKSLALKMSTEDLMSYGVKNNLCPVGNCGSAVTLGSTKQLAESAASDVW